MLNFSFVLQSSDASKFIASKFIHHLTQSQPRNMLNIFHFSTFQPFNLSAFQPFTLSASHQSPLINHDFSTFQVLKSLYLLLIQSFLSMKLYRQWLYYIGQLYYRIIYWVFGCYWGDYLCVWLCVVFVMQLNQKCAGMKTIAFVNYSLQRKDSRSFQKSG